MAGDSSCAGLTIGGAGMICGVVNADSFCLSMSALIILKLLFISCFVIFLSSSFILLLPPITSLETCSYSF